MIVVVAPDLPRVNAVCVVVPIPSVPTALVSNVPPPFRTMSPATSRVASGAVVPIPTLLDPSELSSMSPVEVPPSVRLVFLVVCIVPFDDSDIQLPLVPEDTLATGVPELTLRNPNLALDVAVPPSRRS